MGRKRAGRLKHAGIFLHDPVVACRHGPRNMSIILNHENGSTKGTVNKANDSLPLRASTILCNNYTSRSAVSNFLESSFEKSSG